VDGYENLKTVYVAIDDALGDIREAANPRNVIVVSDHGFGRVPRKRINVSQWLADQGFVEVESDVTPNGLLTKERVEHLLDGTPILSLVPKPIKEFGRELLPSRRIEADDAGSGDEIRYTEYWLHGGFDVPDGGPVEELVSELEGLRDPETGERLFEAVIRTETAYEGPYEDRLPTVLVRFAPNYRGQPTVGGGLVERIPTNAVEPDHRRFGVLLTAGADFATGDDDWATEPHVCDVTPTLLHLLGHPVPSDCDGSVRRELFVDGSDAASEPVASGPPSASERDADDREDADVRARLEDLGYVE
jgi:predicted AlkP superfamily phosphohydrolase/phosphomutase